MGSLGYDEYEDDEGNTIAQITFAFRNAWIVARLQERGKQICAQNWDKVDKIEKEINDALHEKDETGQATTKAQELLDGLQTPCGVFVTFCTEEGHARACEYNNQIDPENPLCVENMVRFDKFLGGEINIEGAAAPSDIIWENRELSWKQRCVRGSVAVFAIGIMLLLSGVVIFLCQTTSLKLKNKYPSIPCAGENGFLATEYDMDWESIKNAAVKEYAEDQ